LVSENAAALVIDADNAMGQVAANFAMQHAIDRARTTHVAFAAVRGSNHCGAMDHWAMLALPHDMIGIATTNALPTMAPWGGVDKIVGINPLAVALPGWEEAGRSCSTSPLARRRTEKSASTTRRDCDPGRLGVRRLRASRRPMRRLRWRG